MLLSLLYSILTTAAWGAPALPIGISAERELNPEGVTHLIAMTKSAVEIVIKFAPRGMKNHLFHWTGRKKLLEGKSIEIRFATSRTSWIQSFMTGTRDSDAFTVSEVDLANRRMRIVIVLLVDRLFYDSSGNQHPDGFARLVLALAHEIFGNVQDSLEDDFDKLRPQTDDDRIKLELRAFRASLSFLRGLKKNPAFRRLPKDLQNGLLGRLPSEIKAYRTWLNSHSNESMDPECEVELE
jgi:hypothetical protein